VNYQTYRPHTDLRSLVKCYWTLEVPLQENPQPQRIVPDGCIEMAFILGDDIKRYTQGEAFLIQPRAMVLGQTLEPFYIEPVGRVETFAVRFYPYSFSNFVTTPLHELANRETPIDRLFAPDLVPQLERQVREASDTQQRIAHVETFLFARLADPSTLDTLVKSTVNALLATRGSQPIHAIFDGDTARRRQLERKFRKQVGLSPKQLGKVIRLQYALKLLLNPQKGALTQIAYESEYYDQNHFIKDFKEFTGATPKEFLSDESLKLSSLFYSKD
jgi:AraC-like DNA-binding protein